MEEFAKIKRKNAEEPLREDIEVDVYNQLPASILNRMFIYYLQKPFCVFKGYILKNYPRDHDEAKSFIEELQANNLKDDFDAFINIMPDYEQM